MDAWAFCIYHGGAQEVVAGEVKVLGQGGSEKLGGDFARTARGSWLGLLHDGRAALRLAGFDSGVQLRQSPLPVKRRCQYRLIPLPDDERIAFGLAVQSVVGQIAGQGEFVILDLDGGDGLREDGDDPV